MRHPRVLNSQQALLLIVDIQEAFRKNLSDVGDLSRNVSILVEAAKILDIPIFLTEQYPQGLGKTLAEIQACLGDYRYFDKSAFSCCGAEGFAEALKSTGKNQIIVCGIEAHVCVSQTVHDLLQLGYSVHVLTDAISSRHPKNKEVGLQKMVASGAVISCLEMALFELLVQSGTETFKAVQRLIK
jgi:nicotinamidase-related amidase